MIFALPGMKEVIIKNRTGEDFKDVYLVYEGLEKHPFKIPTIINNGQQTINLVLMYLTKPTTLTLFYYKNYNKEEVVVYDDLWKEDLRTLTLTASMINDKLHVETTVEERFI